MLKLIENLVEVQTEEIPDINESTSAKQLRLYHHTLEKMEEPKDSEDVYQDYVWKVDKIYSHHRRGRNTFVHVQWKRGNRSWISLKSLRLHDPYSCVIYAVTKNFSEMKIGLGLWTSLMILMLTPRC